MKLEVGESLALSWLRHVRECDVVQLNWKMSPKAWTRFCHERRKYKMLKGVFVAARESFSLSPGDNGRQVFKTDVDFDQFIRQGEIDTLGLRLRHKNSNRIDVHAIAVEIAFHEGGLNYGGKLETASRVAKKMLRGAFLLSGPLGATSGEIIFATPKIGKASLRLIEPMIGRVQAFWKTHAAAHRLPRFEFSFNSGKNFNIQLLQPLLEAGEEVADTSELFLRSYQLLSIFDTCADKTGSSNSAVRAKASPLAKPRNAPR